MLWELKIQHIPAPIVAVERNYKLVFLWWKACLSVFCISVHTIQFKIPNSVSGTNLLLFHFISYQFGPYILYTHYTVHIIPIVLPKILLSCWGALCCIVLSIWNLSCHTHTIASCIPCLPLPSPQPRIKTRERCLNEEWCVSEGRRNT
jgi:hypothetical protein